MSNKENVLYGMGIMVVIISCVFFYHYYVYTRLPETLEIPTSYLTGNYRELDSLAICNGDVEEISCFFYMLPQAYNIGYDMIMANRYKNTNSSYLFFGDLLCLSSDKRWDYSDDQLNAKLEKMDDSLRVIALRHLSHSIRLYSDIVEDSIRIGKYASLYDSIYTQEHQGMKGDDNE